MFSVKEIIDQGENSCVDFKRASVRPERLAREMIAFANSSGGTILIGVEDDKSITGLTSDKNFEEWIANIARNNVVPPIVPTIREELVDGTPIAVVDIPKGPDRPYQDLSGRYYIRAGSTNRIASINELMRLFQQTGLFHYDQTGVERTGFAALNQTAIDQYFQAYDVDYIEMNDNEKVRILKNTDIMTDSGEVSVAGNLVFGINPQRFQHNAMISFAHFAGIEMGEELIDKQNIEGTLPQQIINTLAVIKHNLSVPSTIEGVKRVEALNNYPDIVFRELLVNACCHRNYSITGSRIRIFMFSNRIEFISPGRLPNTINVEKLRAGVSYAINPIIVKLMENLRFIDKLGRGLPMVCLQADKLGKEVTFEEIGEEFKVTLFWES